MPFSLTSCPVAVNFVNWTTPGDGVATPRTVHGRPDVLHHPFGLLREADNIPLSHYWTAKTLDQPRHRPRTMSYRPVGICPPGPRSLTGAIEPSIPDRVGKSTHRGRDMVATTQLSTIAVVLLRARTRWDSSGDLERTAAELSEMDSTVRQEVTRFQGFVAARVGTLWHAVFGAHGHTEDQDERSVLAALHIRRRLTTTDTRTVRAAIVSSEVSADALNDCHARLPRVPATEVWVCARTHQRTESTITYRPTSTPMWAATAPAPQPPVEGHSGQSERRPGSVPSPRAVRASRDG